MNGGEEISREFVVSRCNSPEILEPAEGSLNDVSAFVGPLIETVEPHPVGFVGNDGFCAELEDLRAKGIAVISFIGDEYVHARRERQNTWRCGNVGVLTRREMEGKRPAVRIAQRVDFCRAPAT